MRANTNLYVDHLAYAEARLWAVVKSDWLYRLLSYTDSSKKYHCTNSFE